MLLQFKVIADESVWICDVQHMQFARVSAPAADAESKVLESGKLVPQGFGIYAFEGRTPKTESGAGLRSIGNYVVAIGQTVKIFLRANVPVKDFTMPVPIRQVLYEILPTDPQQHQSDIQGGADANSQEPAEKSQAAEEPSVGGTVSGGEPQAEQPQTEAGVQSSDGTLGEPVA
jgi:hypothetical protein